MIDTNKLDWDLANEYAITMTRAIKIGEGVHAFELGMAIAMMLSRLLMNMEKALGEEAAQELYMELGVHTVGLMNKLREQGGTNDQTIVMAPSVN